jgi:hypothetical protein
MKNLKGGRLRLPLKVGANPNILNLSNTPLEMWDALTPLEAVDYSTPAEDVQIQRSMASPKSARQDPWPKLTVFNAPSPMNNFKGGRLRLPLNLS